MILLQYHYILFYLLSGDTISGLTGRTQSVQSSCVTNNEVHCMIWNWLDF